MEAEEYGAQGNVTLGQITEIVTTIPGVDEVENREDWLTSEGADEENDSQLQSRYQLRWSEGSGTMKYAYESWARSVTGVVAARILDQHPRGQGTVDVVVKGTAGIPTQQLLDAVSAVVAANAHMNDDWLVKGPQPVSVDIDCELELVYGDAGQTAAEVEARVRALFTDPTTVQGIEPLQIGEDLTRDRLVAAIMAVRGIKRVNWTSPAGDVAVPEDGLAVLGELAITTVQATEI